MFFSRETLRESTALLDIPIIQQTHRDWGCILMSAHCLHICFLHFHKITMKTQVYELINTIRAVWGFVVHESVPFNVNLKASQDAFVCNTSLYQCNPLNATISIHVHHNDEKEREGKRVIKRTGRCKQKWKWYRYNSDIFHPAGSLLTYIHINRKIAFLSLILCITHIMQFLKGKRFNRNIFITLSAHIHLRTFT